MANRFQFKLLTGSDPQAQYNAISTKDAYTFYLLKNGIGYLGTTKLFDATEDVSGSSGLNIITDMTGEGYTGDDTTVASTKAIVDYVTAKVSNVSTALTTAFFRKVESHTITTEDLSNPAISVPEGTAEGDIGLLFTADTDGENGGEEYYFISLKSYLSTVYTFENSNSIKMNVSADNKVNAELNIKSTETSLKIDKKNGGVYLEKATSINDGDGTEENGPAPSADKLVTEEALVNYVINSVLPAVDAAITEALQNVVTYSEDNGTTTS